MLKRDSLTAQMQQLSQVLAKAKRLIIEDHESEAKNVVFAIFLDYYSLNEVDLLSKSEEEFIQLLKERGFVAEELNMLGYFVDEYAGLQDEFTDQVALYKKLIHLFDYLERDLHFISFDHITRKGILEQQLEKLP